MLKSAAVATAHALRPGLRLLLAAAVQVERVAFAAVVVMLWPLIFVVLALISGMFGWTAVAANMNGFAVQLFSLLLALFILVVSLSLIGANIED